MPSREGLMTHLRQTHWERLTWACEVGFKFDRLSVADVARLHGIFHKLDRANADLPSPVGSARLQDDTTERG